MNAASGVFRIIQLVLGAIGGIALLVASIGIANTMTMATYERTREIGIMKAVGASGKQVRALFLFEAAVIGLLGGVGGLLFAVTAAGLGNLLVASLGTAGQNPVTGGGGSLFYIPVPLALFAVTFSALVGLVAGTLPAVRAANLDPLAALRHE
jgi:putative ABC transport system permease protein